MIAPMPSSGLDPGVGRVPSIPQRVGPGLHKGRLVLGTGGGPPGPVDWPSPSRRERERHPRPQAGRGSQPSPLGGLSRQRCLVGRTELAPYSTRGYRPQPSPLHRAPRPERCGGCHQDPPATILLPGRQAHPQGTPHHLSSFPWLALAGLVQSDPGETPVPATTPLVAQRRLIRPTGCLNCLAHLRQLARA